MDMRPDWKETEVEYTPEEAALLMRIRIFSNMRWLAIAGVIVATLVASEVFNIDFPTLPVYIICACMVTYNLARYRQVRSLTLERAGLVIPRARAYSNLFITLDLVALTALVHFTGGIENPFIFIYVIHIITASIGLPYRTAYTLAISALGMFLLLVLLEYFGIVPHVNLAGFAAEGLYQEVSYIVAVMVALATVVYGAAFMATAISGELRKRQREVLQLREQLLAEKTGELERAAREVAKLEEDKNRFIRFIGIAAHDLKAPLTAIQSFLWIMLGGYSGPLTDKQRNMLERSTHRITELLNLISDLLDIPRIEADQVLIEMKEISFREVIRRSLADLRNSVKDKGLKLEVEMPQSLPKIRGSSTRLQQVMTNLVSNAINYTHEGGVTVRVTERDKDLQVEVIDTGIGIPPEDLPRVFEDFFRASNVEVKGTGLGLAITRRIIEAHGGTISVESPCIESNKGCRFTCFLPKNDKARRKQKK